MGKPKYVLDTNAFIGIVKGLFGTIPAVSLPLDGKMYVSIITRMEALAYPKLTTQEEVKIRAVLRQMTVIPLKRKIEEEAIRIRAKTKIKLPDSIIAATAVMLKAVLLSNDTDLLNANWSGLTVRSISSAP